MDESPRPVAGKQGLLQENRPNRGIGHWPNEYTTPMQHLTLTYSPTKSKLRHLAMLLMVCAPWFVRAQVATFYAFSQAPGTYTEITGGTTLWNINTFFGVDLNSFNDEVSGAQTIPAFSFNGTTYTQMYVSVNGFITFGSAPAGTNYAPLSNGAGYARCISAFGSNLNNGASGTGTRDVRWQVVGNEIVVQWRRVRRLNLAEVFSFQIRLNTSTGAIRTIYGPHQSGPNASTTLFPEVGLRGPDNTFPTNVNNRFVGDLADGINWGNSQAGAANNSKLRFSSTAPAKSWTSGLTYAWTPVCSAPVATASVTADCATGTYSISVNVTGLGGGPSVTVQSPTGTDVHSNVGTGTHVISGIPIGSARTVTLVHNGNILCNLSLGSFNYVDADQVCHAAAVYPIADNGCAGGNYTSVPFCVQSAGTALGTDAFVQSVDVIVSHTWGSDLRLYLRSPNNTEVGLVNTPHGGNGTQYGNAAVCPAGLFRFQAGGTALSAVVGASTNVGTWTPDQPLTGFHNGANPNGTWTLRACDAVGADLGAVRYVRVNLCTPALATYTAVDNCANSQFSVQVNVTSFGGGAVANLNYTVNGVPFSMPNIGLGTTTIGPFAVGAEVVCTVDNGVSNCGSTQGVVYSNCPIVIACGTTVPMTHCYRNNDTRTFTFTSSNPFETVTVSFIGGTMGPNDLIRAYDGPNNSAPSLASLTGNFANLVGATATTTGTTMFIEIDSDGSNSCASGQQTSWSFEAECTAGCVDPNAAITVNTNCAAYNFTIDVEVLFTGDAATTDLRYTVNGGAPTIIPDLVELDLETVGPFAMGDQVNIRLLHESDPACDHNFGNFTNAPGCPSAENCVNALNLATQTSPLPGTTVGRTHDFTFVCGTAIANTAADAIYYMDVPDGQQLRIRQQTNNYNSQHYVRYGGACPGTTVIACVNDDNGEIGWVEWTNSTGSAQRAWWIQDGVGTGTGTYTLEWQLLTCPIPTANAASGITNVQANANFTATAGNYIVEWGPAATFTTPGSGLAPGTNGTVISTSASPTLISGLSANTQYRYFVRRNCGGGNFSPNTSGITFTTTNAPTVVANNTCGNNVTIVDNGCAAGTYALASVAISGQPSTLGTNVGLASVEIILTHTYRADLIISLISPTGQEILLSNARGGSGDNFGNNGSCPSAVFRFIAGGAALTSIPATTANVTGNYAPEQALTGFNTGNPNGNWIVKICDNVGADTGGLRFVKLNFLPIDCLGVLGGTAMPGTACNDNNVCTINDTWSAGCACAGVFQDADNDGTCDANDGCPNDPGKIAPGQCGCGVADTDSDADLTADCNDACPLDPNKIAPGQCGCGVADTDGDNDGVADCNDACPTVANAIPGGACNDGNAFTFNDVYGASPTCGCAGTACTTSLELEFQMDGGSAITWELRVQGTNAIIQTGLVFLPVPGIFTQGTCLPDGCFYLKVMDDQGDGMTSNGVVGGYTLRALAPVKRLVDNRNNFGSGAVSQIAGNVGFCLPLGNDRLISASCDRMDLQRGANAQCSEKLTADNTPNNTSGNVYQFWIYNPNGPESQFIPAMGSSPGSNVLSMNQVTLPAGKIYNVKVRTRASAGVWREWGPACRMSISPVPMPCRLTSLVDDTSSPNWSCGKTVALPAVGGGNGAQNMLVAKPVARLNANCVEVGANKYQFRFRDVDTQAITTVNGVGTNYFCYMTQPLFAACREYEVAVRASFDGGANWCPYSTMCTVFTGGCIGGGGENMVAQNSRLRMYPNPNRGDQLMLSLENVAAEVSTVSVDIYDAFGKRVSARTIAVQDGFVNTVLDLNGELAAGLYMVNITAGNLTCTERLVIQP